MEMDQINGSCSFTLAFDDGIRAAIVRHNCHPNVRSIRIALNYIRERGKHWKRAIVLYGFSTFVWHLH